MWDSAYMNNPLGYKREEQKDQAQEIFEAQARERYEYCVALATVFKGPKGKEVLKQWRENTIESGTWLPSIAMQYGKDAAVAHGFAREGQNAFVRDIENCIKIATECKTLEDFYNKINQTVRSEI
jgi:hypothetical protein